MTIKTQLTFHEWPHYDALEENELIQVLKSRKWWRMAGNSITDFEKSFASAHGTSYALAVSNGTHAIELALTALGIGEGDEVIVPAYTFISTASPVFRLGGTPVAVDVDPLTYCIDPQSLENAITNKTKAIIIVHFAGHAAPMDEIMALARTNNLYVIEDAAHAHGGSYNQQSLGSIGDISCFSFQYMKLMTSGEGGALTTNDQELYERCWLLHNVGRRSDDRLYQHEVLGSNYRMSEFQAAVLNGQLHRLQPFNAMRMENAKVLSGLLSDMEGLECLAHLPYATIHPYYMFTLRYRPQYFGGLSRLEFVDRLKALGVPAFVGYSAIHQTKVWKDYQGKAMECPIAETAAQEMIWLHHRVLLSRPQEIEALVDAIREIQSERRKVR